MPDKKHILADIETIVSAYEKIRRKTKGHVDFADMNLPGYVCVTAECLIANLVDKSGRDYLINIRRLDKKE